MVSGLFLVLGLVVCADRARINPLDPRNPQTGGKPTGFRLYSIEDSVFLSWDRLDLQDLTGYQIYRRSEAETSFRKFAFVAEDENEFVDTSVDFGEEYAYRITAVGGTYESAPSETLAIVPGPTFTWSADRFNRQLLKLTHDSRHLVLRADGFFIPIAMEVSASRGQLWVAESFRRQVVRVESDGTVTLPAIQFSHPVDVAINQRTGEVWVADIVDDEVAKVSAEGNILLRVRQSEFGERFRRPVSLAVDDKTGACWMVDTVLNRVFAIESDGSRVQTSPATLERVQAIAVDAQRGRVWVADSTRVVELSRFGEVTQVLSEPFDFAFQVATDMTTGAVWVLEFSFEAGEGSVSKFAFTGEKAFEVDGFTGALDIAVNFYDNSCVVADTENDRIVRISADGEVVGTFSDAARPEVVAVANPPGLF